MPKHVRLSSYHNIVPNHNDNHKQIDLRNFHSVSTDPNDEKIEIRVSSRSFWFSQIVYVVVYE